MTRDRLGFVVIRWLSVPVGLLLSALLVWHSSNAAFIDTTSNAGSNWTAGTVTLTDDDANAAMFSVSNAKPGDTGSKCIEVSYGGSLAAAVKTYAASYTTTNSLGQHVNLVVEEGSPGTFASCSTFSGATLFSGTLQTYATTRTNFSNGVGTWTPAGQTAPATEDKTYKITWTLDPATPDSAQGGTAAVEFVWEAQNT